MTAQQDNTPTQDNNGEMNPALVKVKRNGMETQCKAILKTGSQLTILQND